MPDPELGRDYLRLALRLRELVPRWVEYYTGPPELPDAVRVQRPVSVRRLQDEVEELTDRVDRDAGAGEADRRRWLLAQLRALATALRQLDGEELEYSVLFERCHGAPVKLIADQQFERAHSLLDRALPGRGEVAARYRAWRETQLVAPERLQPALELLAGEMRRRSRERFGLPEPEEVSWELVRGVPYAGNAAYLGHRHTRVKINADLPIGSPRLLELVCHEAYPGHHSEQVCKEADLIEPHGREELLVYLYPTPQALLAEGLASYALEALLGEAAEEIAAECLRSAGISYDPETAAIVRRAEELLLPVRSNIAWMLHGGASSAEVHAYARTWLLDRPEDTDEAIGHLEARAWRPYESCYPVGLALCRRYAAGDPGRFRDLLQRQLTPADLVAS